MYKDWDNFVASHPLGTIHQTSFWGEFQSRTPGRDKYFVIEVGAGTAKSGGLFIRHKLPFGLSWLYCPRGPLCNYSNETQLNAIMKKLAPIAKQERAVFVRIDPPIEISAAQKFPAGFRNAHAEYQPAHTLVIDLSQTEEQILAQMKPKGRYNIKVAQKHNVIVRPATTATLKRDISAFYKLLNQTSQRDKFSIHPKSYYENMLKILGQRNLTKLFIAEYAPAGHTAAHNRAKKIIAGIIVTFFSTTATYYFGASDYEYRNLMAPYLLQWEAICEAKSSGCKFYDFLGIAPLDSSGAPLRGHPYAALTDFKLKFGGRIVSYAPAKEFAYKPIWYSLMKFAKKLI